MKALLCSSVTPMFSKIKSSQLIYANENRLFYLESECSWSYISFCHSKIRNYTSFIYIVIWNHIRIYNTLPASCIFPHYILARTTRSQLRIEIYVSPTLSSWERSHPLLPQSFWGVSRTSCWGIRRGRRPRWQRSTAPTGRNNSCWKTVSTLI